MVSGEAWAASRGLIPFPAMRALPLICVLVFAACSNGTAGETTTVVTLGSLPTITEATTASTPAPTSAELDSCDPPDTLPRVMPDRVVPDMPDPSVVEFDEFTLIAGTHTAMRFDEAGDTVLVIIRGALPPRQFTGESERVEILDGIPALVGPIGDGYWAAAWAIPPGDRCDLYSLIFYPPADADTALEVTASVG